MSETTSREFVEWQEYLDLDRDTPQREDYYLAQIAAEVRRGMVKAPARVHLKHFLLKFSRKDEEEKPLTEDQIKRRAANSKARWSALLRFKSKQQRTN
ncbi:hypothetical protein KKH23_10960 [Patescibacteria group bacterium]|nr:hypothetical protein [Patescibacteria group bacterium]MBU1067257.1 hypothetical protein [Patescibacteria group bacterium]